jgi:hypothetical protein
VLLRLVVDARRTRFVAGDADHDVDLTNCSASGPEDLYLGIAVTALCGG